MFRWVLEAVNLVGQLAIALGQLVVTLATTWEAGGFPAATATENEEEPDKPPSYNAQGLDYTCAFDCGPNMAS